MARIFLSYAREDERQVRDVYRRLLDVGFDGWMDKIDLLPGQRWQQEIPHAIRNSDFILIFFSKHSVAKRGYIQSEFRLVLDTLGYLLALLVTSANEQDRHQVAALAKPL